MKKWLVENRIYFGKDGIGAPQLKRYLNEVQDGRVPTTWWTFEAVGHNDAANKELSALFNSKTPFDTPKPSTLIKQMLKISTINNDIILDFFSGSATTAHAVMQLNAEDGGNRQFIMVQLPERCAEKSEAYKAGYQTIADIGKERIKRAGQKIKNDNANKTDIDKLDIGFRVLKIDSSNMNEVYYTPHNTAQEDLINLIDNIKTDRSDEDLLFQVFIDCGIELTLPITQDTIDNKTVFIVVDNQIIACFDRSGGINESFIQQLCALKPKRVVFCDSGFSNDSVKINTEQLFKSLSEHTDIKII
jgi:adenine-specific DNA-methyltransferase